MVTERTVPRFNASNINAEVRLYTNAYTPFICKRLLSRLPPQSETALGLMQQQWSDLNLTAIIFCLLTFLMTEAKAPHSE